MKLIVKSLLMIVSMIGVMTYGMYLLTGRLPWQGMTLPHVPEVSLPDKVTLSGTKAEKDKVYKWRDAEGQLHFSSEPPENISRYELLELDPNVNVIDAVPVESPEEEEKEIVETEKPKVTADDPAFPYSPERVKKLMDDAREVQEKLNERAKAQEEILNNL